MHYYCSLTLSGDIYALRVGRQKLRFIQNIKMSFPDRQQRKMCWDARDVYWVCLDKQNVKDSSEIPKACSDLRKVFEKSCPSQWVSHFDRKRDFNVFKEKMQKEGYEPIKDETK